MCELIFKIKCWLRNTHPRLQQVQVPEAGKGSAGKQMQYPLKVVEASHLAAMAYGVRAN